MKTMTNAKLVNISEEELKIQDIYYKICVLPASIRAFVTQKNQDTLILINSRLSFEEQQKAFLHELIHIQKNHFEHYSYDNNYRNFCENQVNELLN